MGGDAIPARPSMGQLKRREAQEALLQVAAALQEVPRRVQAAREGRARADGSRHGPLRARASTSARRRSRPLAARSRPAILRAAWPPASSPVAAGFLGSHLCDELLARGHRVICVDNFETGSLANIEHLRGPDFVFVHTDVTEPFFVETSRSTSSTTSPRRRPDRLPAAAAAHAEGRLLRDASRARPGEAAPRALPDRVDVARSTAIRRCIRSRSPTGAT